LIYEPAIPPWLRDDAVLGRIEPEMEKPLLEDKELGVYELKACWYCGGRENPLPS